MLLFLKEKKDVPKYTKTVLKKGDGNKFPKKGDLIHIKYVQPSGYSLDSIRFKGTVQSTGHVFQDITTEKKPFSVKIGIGQVTVFDGSIKLAKLIRGWDEGILTMSVGEKAILIIDPDWAYGKKGKPEAKIPPDATLVFEVELIKIG